MRLHWAFGGMACRRISDMGFPAWWLAKPKLGFCGDTVPCIGYIGVDLAFRTTV